MPPSARKVPIWLCTSLRLLTLWKGTTHLAVSSNPITPMLSRSLSTSRALMAASLAASMREAPNCPLVMLPDLSMQITSDRAGMRCLLRTSILTGRSASRDVPR